MLSIITQSLILFKCDTQHYILMLSVIALITLLKCDIQCNDTALDTNAEHHYTKHETLKM